MAETYAYTGYEELSYISYVDLSTEKMLHATPGKSYSMRTVEEGFPIPPTDGRWKRAAGELPASKPAEFRALRSSSSAKSKKDKAEADESSVITKPATDEASTAVKPAMAEASDSVEEEQKDVKATEDSAAESEEAFAPHIKENEPETPAVAGEPDTSVTDTHEEE